MKKSTLLAGILWLITITSAFSGDTVMKWPINFAFDSDGGVWFSAVDSKYRMWVAVPNQECAEIDTCNDNTWIIIPGPGPSPSGEDSSAPLIAWDKAVGKMAIFTRGHLFGRVKMGWVGTDGSWDGWYTIKTPIPMDNQWR